MQTKEVSVEVMMDKEEATAKRALVLSTTDSFARTVGPILVELNDREGWRALGFKSMREFCEDLRKSSGFFTDRTDVYRVIWRTEVESAIGQALPADHAYALAELPDAEAQREVFAEVMDNYEKPVERNFKTYVERWLKKHQKSAGGKSTHSDSDGWTRADLESDDDLSEALDRIESVYGQADRKAIQDGTIGLSRKDIIALAAFHVSKMKQVQFLIMANHWDVSTAMKFVNKELSSRDAIGDLINHCIGTTGFYYTCSVDGYDITIKACKALASKIKG